VRIEVVGVSVEEVGGEMRGESWEIRVSIVWRGSSGSQDSIHWGVGSNVPFVEKPAVA
jgi:hypothetical protein